MSTATGGINSDDDDGCGPPVNLPHVIPTKTRRLPRSPLDGNATMLPLPWQQQSRMVSVGDTVRYWINGRRESKERIGLVTAIQRSGNERSPKVSVNICIFTDGPYGVSRQNGVHHIDDPDHNAYTKNENGAWEMFPRRQHELSMLAILERMYVERDPDDGGGVG